MNINRHELIDAYREAIKKDVPLEWVLEQQEKIWEEKKKQKKKNSVWKDIPFLLTMIIGLGFIMMAISPMLSFLISGGGNNLLKTSLIAPVPEDKIISSQVLAAEQNTDTFSPLSWAKEKFGQKKDEEQGAVQLAGDINGLSNGLNNSQSSQEPTVVIEDQLDYKNLANWFASTDELFNSHGVSKVQAAEKNEYILDIPKVGINNAVVKFGGTNLSMNLVQYETTAFPGEYGGPSIFGHSTLRQWYNPNENNPERYNSIFSTIMTLEKNDKIYIKYNGMSYVFKVISKQNVKPSDTDKLIGQDTSGKFLKLVTCTPEGTTAMRGIITAVLVEGEDVS